MGDLTLSIYLLSPCCTKGFKQLNLLLRELKRLDIDFKAMPFNKSSKDQTYLSLSNKYCVHRAELPVIIIEDINKKIKVRETDLLDPAVLNVLVEEIHDYVKLQQDIERDKNAV